MAQDAQQTETRQRVSMSEDFPEQTASGNVFVLAVEDTSSEGQTRLVIAQNRKDLANAQATIYSIAQGDPSAGGRKVVSNLPVKTEQFTDEEGNLSIKPGMYLDKVMNFGGKKPVIAVREYLGSAALEAKAAGQTIPGISWKDDDGEIHMNQSVKLNPQTNEYLTQNGDYILKSSRLTLDNPNDILVESNGSTAEYPEFLPQEGIAVVE